MARELGDKLGPRIAELVGQYHLATRGRLATVEARIHQAASQALVDKAGREVSDLFRPLTAHPLETRGDTLHPVMKQHLTRLYAGTHQWESLMGHAQMGAASALSATLSNVLFPGLALINEVDRATPVDAPTAAAAVAAGLASYADGDRTAGAYGVTPEAFRIMHDLAISYPGYAQLLDLLNRGDITEQEAELYLRRTALHPALIAPVIASRYQLLAPADIALGMLRGGITEAEGVALAARQGVDKATLARLVFNTGEPPGIEQMVSLWKRGLIDERRLDRAILQSRVRDEWIPDVKLLAVAPPTQEEVLQALVQGEVTEGEALKRYEQAGGDPSWFRPAWQTRANAPSPEQAAQMAHRGIIPWTGTGGQAVSFEQAFREGRWKDKYSAAFRRLSEYLPPPREVTTLAREGAITEAQATRLWQEHGLTPQLAHTYWLSAHYAKTGGLHQLAESAITRLYYDRAISRAQALEMLTKVRWSKTDADWLLDLTDMRREQAARDSAIAKVRALFISWKIGKNEAGQALADFDTVATERDHLLRTWELERAANVKTLTTAEILDAWYYKIVPVPETLQLLERDGYTAADARLLIQIKNKGKLAGL